MDEATATAADKPPAPLTAEHFAFLRPDLRPARIESEVRRASPKQRAAWQRLGEKLAAMAAQRALDARDKQNPNGADETQRAS